MTTDAAIGFRAHSGWAVLVAVAGPRPSPTVISRRRIVLADPAIPGSVQPYHAAADLAPEGAEQLINRCRNAGRWLAQQALQITLDDLKGQGYQVTACGLLLSSARPLPVLAAILASHALIHTAEGELFRDVLTYASEHHRL